MEQLRHKPFPEIAHALRNRTDAILKHWRTLVVEALPHIDQQTIAQFEDDIAAILALVADSLESDDDRSITALLDKAPSHGLDRFLQQYDLTDLLTENRILRSVIVAELETALDRRLEAPEAASIHAIVDVMFHQGTLTMVQKQHEELRAGAEAERKFLSWLFHDLNNNFLGISFLLQTTSRQIAEYSELSETAARLKAAHETIQRTRNGMKRLLHHERMRHTKPEIEIERFPLRRLIEAITRSLKSQADEEGIDLHVDVPHDWQIRTDPELLALILQNIIHNAIQHSSGGPVRIAASCEEEAEQAKKAENNGRCRISVSDNGLGLKEDALSRIFEAFERGDAPLGTPGVGLGLAIAAQAANALDAQIDVDTPQASPEKISPEKTPGRGTTFHIILQDAPEPAS